ncbi:MAG: hypothetical protein WBX01_13070 [Nitrososphaeraceae archaeon]|jgi:hypothetical protein
MALVFYAAFDNSINYGDTIAIRWTIIGRRVQTINPLGSEVGAGAVSWAYRMGKGDKNYSKRSAVIKHV